MNNRTRNRAGMCSSVIQQGLISGQQWGVGAATVSHGPDNSSPDTHTNDGHFFQQTAAGFVVQS